MDQERALAKLQKNIQISPIMKSNMIRVRYTSPDQKKATQVLNVLAKSYLDRHLELHGDTGSFQFFDGQSTAAERRLKEAQSKLVGFQRTSGEANVLETKDLVLRRQIELQVTLNQAEAELKDTTRRIESIRPRLQQLALRIPTTARRVPNQYSAERMSTLLTELQNRRTELLVKYRPTERIVIQLEQQITDTRKALLEAEGRVSTEEVSDVNPLRQALESELSRAESTEAGLRGRIQAMRGQEQAYRDQLTKLEALSPIEQQYKRDAKVAEDNYLLYAKKREEARIGQSMDQQKISNVVLAERPRAAALPKSRTATLVAAFVLALLLGLVAAILASRMRRTVQTPWDLESVSDVPVVGTVPVQSAPVLPERLRGLQS